MSDIKISEAFLFQLLDNIGAMMGEKCELVFHDFRDGYEATIRHIVNGTLSGRKVGGCPTTMFFDHITDLGENEEKLKNFINTAEKDRILKSSSTLLHDEKGDIIGAVCLNFDITELINAQCTIQNYSGYTPHGSAATPSMPFANEKFISNVDELFDHYLDEVEVVIGKEIKLMSKKEKERAILYLDEHGIFKITNASVKLCKCFGISKYTLYNYLNNAKGNS